MKNLNFSQRSLKEIRIIVEYINAKWSERVSNKFLKKLESNFDVIISNPETFPVSNNKQFRKCVVSKQTTIYYKIINSNTILIASVFDTRQNPVKVKKIK